MASVARPNTLWRCCAAPWRPKGRRYVSATGRSPPGLPATRLDRHKSEGCARGMGAGVPLSLAYLSAPVDAASLAVVRIVLGAMIAWDAVRFYREGWIAEYYILPKWHFTYPYFHWLAPWPGVGMYVHYAAIAALGVLVALGLF